MSNNDFIGPFKNVAPLYIEYKKSLGYKSEAEFNELKKLDRYFYNKDIDPKFEDQSVFVTHGDWVKHMNDNK